MILLFFVGTSLSAELINHGVLYEHIQQQDPAVSIYLLKIDPAQVQIIAEAAHGKCKSTEKVSEIAVRKNAIAAINGGFFDFGQKNRMLDTIVKLLDCVGYNRSNTYPVFCLKIRDRWFSLSHLNAGIVGWGNNQPAFMDTVQITWHLEIDGRNYPITEINKPYAKGPTLFTSAYDTHSQKKERVTEIVVEDGVIAAIVKGNGETRIPENGFIYSVETTYRDRADVAHCCVGMAVSLIKNYNNEKHAWEDAEFLLASTPLLIKDGEITQTIYNGTSTFYTKQHPRTAIGLLPNGHWIFVVVEGRKKHSIGMTLMELAQFMENCGCVNALNLDGGGSSVMVIENELMNVPPGREWALVGGERNVSTALLVVPREQF